MPRWHKQNTHTSSSFDSVDHGLSSDTSSYLCSRYPISIPSGFRGRTCIQQKFPLSGSIIGAEFTEWEKKINEISLCFWMDINHTSHSLAFLFSFCVDGTEGLGPCPPPPPPSLTQEQGACDNDWDDIEIGTPKIPKKEKSFVVFCICFLDHQLCTGLAPRHVTLLVGSARRAPGNGLGDGYRGRAFERSELFDVSGSGISAMMQDQGWQGKGDCEHRATTVPALPFTTHYPRPRELDHIPPLTTRSFS